MSIIKVNAIQHTSANDTNMTFFANGNIAMTTANTVLRVGNTAISNSGISVGGVAVNPLTTGMRNRIINGDMRIDQRYVGAANTVNALTAQYNLDRWRFDNQSDAVLTVRQMNSANSSASNYESGSAPSGFINSMKITVATADSSLTTNQYCQFQQPIEGLNCADLDWGTANAKTVTLSFWVKSSVSGSYSFAMTNYAGNRTYPTTYTINQANTWEYKSITIPGDTTGTWLTNNSIGLFPEWFIGYWSGYAGSSTGWNAGTQFLTTGTNSIVGTLNATLYITGVQLEAGTVATPFEWRHYGQELALCQRYYWQGNGLYVYNGTGATITAGGQTSWGQTMRITPATTVQTGGIIATTSTGVTHYVSGVTSGSSGNPGIITANAEL